MVNAMFRSRLSWTLLGGVGLLGLTRDLGTGLRGALLALAIAGFVWLNQPQLAWLTTLRAAGDDRWRPVAAGLALRCVALMILVAFSW